MSRKRRRRFSFGQLEGDSDSPNESRRELDDIKTKLSAVDWSCATCDEFMAMMNLRFGARCARDIVSVATVVPVTCGPWREEIAAELLGLLTTNSN